MIKFKDRIDVIYLLMIFIVAIAAVKIERESSDISINNGFLNLYENIFEENKIIKLNGNWEYYNNKFIIPKDIQFFSSEKKLSELKKIEKNNYGTYSLEFEIENIAAIYGIEIPPVYGSYEVYLNDEKIAENGVLNSKEDNLNSTVNRKYIPIKINKKRNNLVVYMSNKEYKIGGFKGYIEIGEYSDIIQRRESLEGKLYLFIGIILALVTYKAVIYYVKRERDETLYFIFFALSIMLFLIIKMDFNFIKNFYLLFRVEYILKIVIPIILIFLNNQIFNKEKIKIRYKIIFVFIVAIFIIKIENYIPVNILYFLINLISSLIFYYNMILLIKKGKDVIFLKNTIFIVILIMIYSSISELYNKEFIYETFAMITIVVAEAIIIIKKAWRDYGANIIASKELDISKDKLERIVFYKSMIMEKEKLKWSNFIKHFKEIAIIIDEEGNIIECNPATVKFFEVLESDILNKKIWDLEFRYTTEEEKTLTNYHRIKNIYIDLIEEGTHFSNDISEIIKLENESGKIRKINITRFSIPTKNGKMVGVIAREINFKLSNNAYMEEEKSAKNTKIELFYIEDILKLINSDENIKLLRKYIEVENNTENEKKLIGNSLKIYQIIRSIVLEEDEVEILKKVKIKFENISEGKEYVVLGINLVFLKNTKLEHIVYKTKKDIEKQYNKIRENIENIGGKMNIINRNREEKEISFYIKIKKSIDLNNFN